MNSLTKNKVIKVEEKEFIHDLNDLSYIKTNFSYVSAKNITFKNMTFLYCNFTNCYFRNCKFIECDFTGSSFDNSNLRGSTFNGSKFDYSSFSKTIVSISILDNNLPGYENIALEFARSLRVNFSQIGLTAGINKAIKVELDCTRIHYKKAFWSKESYYRNKYSGLNRLKAFFTYYSFIIFDFLWGNGESFLKICRSNIIFLLLISLILFYYNKSITTSFYDSFQLLFAVPQNKIYPSIIFPIVGLIKYILFGLLLTVLIKNLSRR